MTTSIKTLWMSSLQQYQSKIRATNNAYSQKKKNERKGKMKTSNVKEQIKSGDF